MDAYDPDTVRSYFDAYGEREWQRLERAVAGETAFAIHWRLLAPEVRPGLELLDAGCGPGRYALELLRAGAAVTLADISIVQLGLAEANIRAAGLEGGLRGIHEADVCDLSAFGDASFDLVVCYGGGISYTCERHPQAIRELVRVLRPGGTLAVSVMSLYGVLQLIGLLDIPEFLETMPAHLALPASPLPGVVVTEPRSREFHQPLALFSADHLAACVRSAGCEVLRTGVANPISWGLVPLERTAQSEAARAALRGLELALCEEPALRDRGDHIVLIARKLGA